MASSEGPGPAIPERLQFHWIKSNQFRVIHADGAYGGITPRGLLHFAFYSERAAIPKLTSRPLEQGPDGSVVAGAERRDDGKEGLVREVDIEVLMDAQTAEEFLTWLSDKVKILREIATNDADNAK